MVKATIANAYPKIPRAAGEKNLRNALNRLETGKITPAELEETYVETIVRVVREQNAAGLDLVSDGQIRWDDPLVKFTAGVNNLDRGGLLRYFDNNTYYRRSIIRGDLSLESSSLVEDYRLASAHSAVPVKAILPAPYTFSVMIEDNYYFDQQRLIEALCQILIEEIGLLKEAGCKIIQMEDPMVLESPQAIEWAAYWFNRVSAAHNLEYWLSLYFGPFSNLGERMNEYNASCVAVDVVSHPEDFEVFCRLKSDKMRCFGLIDARDIRMEEESATLDKMHKAAAACKGRDFYISASASLEYLPPDEAYQKLLLLGKLKERFNKGV